MLKGTDQMHILIVIDIMSQSKKVIGHNLSFDLEMMRIMSHRVQITVKTSDTRAMSWAKALDFVPECNMLRYSADKYDYTLFRRL